MVGEIAIFDGGEQHGLISMVKTHPDYRRQGICSRLLFNSIPFTQERFKLKDYVIVADTKGNAASVYKSLGFKVVEHGASLIKKW